MAALRQNQPAFPLSPVPRWQFLLKGTKAEKNASRRLLFNSLRTDTSPMFPEIDSLTGVHSKLRPAKKLTVSERFFVVLLTIGIPVVMGIAMWLTPDPRGFGTHQQLGMPACTFRTVTGLNCPHCGLTTSFSWFVRGRWKQAAQINAAGLVLAAAAVLIWPWLITVIIKGCWLGTRSPGLVLLISFSGWLLLSLGIWILRLTK